MVEMSNGRGHSCKVSVVKFKDNVWGKFFQAESGDTWNLLPALVVEADIKV